MLSFSLAILLLDAVNAASHSRKHPRSRFRPSRPSTRLIQPSASLASEWSYQGCYQDNESNRLLSTRVYSGSANTQQSCINTCNNGGYMYAGLEFGQECWCGIAISNPQTATCSMPCTGNSTQTCGGPDVISVFAKTEPTPRYQSYGCYVDSSSRILGSSSVSSAKMTTDLCADFCEAQSYPYFGTENGNECWCGSSLPSSSERVTSSQCATPCSGQSGSVCGAGWKINVYGLTGSSGQRFGQTGSQYGSVGSSPFAPQDQESGSSNPPSSDYIGNGLSGLPASQNQDTGSSDPLFEGTGSSTPQSQENAPPNNGLPASNSQGTTSTTSASSTSTSMSTSTPTASTTSSTTPSSPPVLNPVPDSSDGTPTTNQNNNGQTYGSGSGSGSSTSSGPFWTSSAGDSGNKHVFAHFMVGNSYSYTSSKWTTDIQLASSQGIDGFALNVGSDSWEPSQIATAYAAAQSSGTNFKLFISFDMTSVSCSDTSFIVQQMQTYSGHPNQMKDDDGAMWVATFSGDGCMSGSAWKSTLDSAGVSYRFIPAFFNSGLSPTNTLKDVEPAIGGDFLWNGGWPLPTAAAAINWDQDGQRISVDGLNRAGGDIYMAAVSPWFFTHWSGRNSVYDCDNWLYAQRWEELHDQRDSVDAVEIITWNDWGESHYIAPVDPVQGDIPAGAFWATSQYDHTAWLYMTSYYISYFKTGVRPTVTSDKIFMWARTMSVNTDIPGDSIGKPDNIQFLSDTLFVVLFATGPGTLTVNRGSNPPWVQQVNAGVNMLNTTLVETSSVNAVLSRNGQQVFSFDAPLFFGTGNPTEYNYNAITASGP